MKGLRIEKLRRLYESAVRSREAARFFADLQGELESGHIKPEDFQIRELFEHFVPNGRELVSTFDPRHAGSVDVTLLEAAGVVSTQSFANITNVVLSSRVMGVWNDPEFIGDQLVETIPSSMERERIAGIGGVGDEAEVVPEGHDFPTAGFSEEYVDTPATKKRGFIVPVTKEAIFFDRTGMVLRRAGEIAKWLRVNKEKRILDAVLGVTNTYRRNGVASNTYLTAAPYINTKTSNALVDWTDIEGAALLFEDMTDPNTGEPISPMGDTVLVPGALAMTAKRIVSATEVRFGDGASSTSQTISKNPIDGNLKVLSNQYVKSRSGSSTTWWLGSPRKAFAYIENHPIAVVQAPPNSEAEFVADIVSRFKVSERGAVGVLEPRYMVKSTA